MIRIEPSGGYTAHARLPNETTSRFDHEKLNMLRDALAKAGQGELRRIRVGIDDRTVFLTGEVSSFYLKQAAQEAVRPYAIGLDICNELTVTRNENANRLAEIPEIREQTAEIQ